MIKSITKIILKSKIKIISVKTKNVAYVQVPSDIYVMFFLRKYITVFYNR